MIGLNLKNTPTDGYTQDTIHSIIKGMTKETASPLRENDLQPISSRMTRRVSSRAVYNYVKTEFNLGSTAEIESEALDLRVGRFLTTWSTC